MSPKNKTKDESQEVNAIFSMPEKKVVERCRPVVTSVNGVTMGKRMTELDTIIRKASKCFTNEEEYLAWALNKTKEAMEYAAKTMEFAYVEKRARKSKKNAQQTQPAAPAQ
jgi:hypothetical protein